LDIWIFGYLVVVGVGVVRSDVPGGRCLGVCE